MRLADTLDLKALVNKFVECQVSQLLACKSNIEGALKWRLNLPTYFLNSCRVFQNSNLIGQSNVIVNVGLVYYPATIVHIKGCGIR